MPPTVVPSGSSTRNGAAQPTLESLSSELCEAVKRRNVLVNLLKSSPERVTDEMLVRVRTGLESALQGFAPHLESSRVNRSQIANSHEAVSALYQESIQRHIQRQYTAETPVSVNGEGFYSQARALNEFLKDGKNQIFALEQAIKLGPTDPGLKLPKRLKNAVSLYFMNAARQFFMLETVLNSLHAQSPNSATSQLGDSTGLPVGNELHKYLNLLGKRIERISIGLNHVMKLIMNDPLRKYEFQDLIPMFGPWVKELREHALGLANVLFKMMESDTSPEGIHSPISRNKCYCDIFESALYLVDVSDKMISMGMASTIGETSRQNTRNTAPHHQGIEETLAALALENNPDAHEEDEYNSALTQSPTASDTNTEPSKKTRHLEKLFAKTPFAQFENLKNHAAIFHPDTVLACAARAQEDAMRLKANLQRHLHDCANHPPELVGRIEQKILELDGMLSTLNSSTLQADLYKHYPFPQSKHWLTLLEQQQIAHVSKPQNLPSQKEHLYEIEIVPKPDSKGRQPTPIYLHLHLKKSPTLKKRQSLIGGVLEQPSLIEAAHLKSSYYRNKGKTWENNQQALGQYESLVKRSPVNTAFLASIARLMTTEG